MNHSKDISLLKYCQRGLYHFSQTMECFNWNIFKFSQAKVKKQIPSPKDKYLLWFRWCL